MNSVDNLPANAHPVGRLRKHLVVIIVAKLIILVAIWWCFFRAELRPAADDAAVAEKIISSERNQ